eukprot:1139624-Pelagomonas_calceolata.AAC.1
MTCSRQSGSATAACKVPTYLQCTQLPKGRRATVLDLIRCPSPYQMSWPLIRCPGPYQMSWP